MSSKQTELSRRAVLRTATGATTGSVAMAQEETSTPTDSGTAAGSGDEDGTDGGSGETAPPDFGGFLDDVGNFDGTVVDASAQDSVTVTVGAEGNGGNFAFDPPAVQVDKGTTVQWDGTGEGGEHNVVSDGDGPLDSGEPVTSADTTYEHTFESDGLYNYICEPHVSLGMKGSVVVGTDYPTAGGDGESGESGGGGRPRVPDAAKTLGVATSVTVAVTLGLTYIFIRYGGDYQMAGEE